MLDFKDICLNVNIKHRWIKSIDTHKEQIQLGMQTVKTNQLYY